MICYAEGYAELFYSICEVMHSLIFGTAKKNKKKRVSRVRYAKIFNSAFYQHSNDIYSKYIKEYLVLVL